MQAIVDDLHPYAAFADLLRRWTQRINLIAPSTVEDILARHVADSMAAAKLVPATARRVVDLGSGAGFPGLIVASELHRHDRPATVILVEADQRKCAFLQEAARLLQVPVEIRAARIMDVPPLQADVVMARALAPLEALLDFQARHGTQDATGLYLKGAGHLAEVAEARTAWGFDLEIHPGIHPGSAVLGIRTLRKAV